MKITLKPYQAQFMTSPAKYLAMIAGWGTGKSLCLIARGIELSDSSPNNLGVIVRKEYTDLRDSTISDFSKYTGLTLDSNKEIKFRNGSVIMFRHGKELDVLKNINLGWFGIEQGEEFESDEQFIYLMGRLRRSEIPDQQRMGIVVANANGKNWIYRWWKDPVSQREREKQLGEDIASRFELIEANTYDNADNLPQDYLTGLEVIKVQRPELYKRFVLNSYEAEDSILTLFKGGWIDRAESGILVPYEGFEKRFISYDCAGAGGDLNVVYVWKNNEIVGKEIWQQTDKSNSGCLLSSAKVALIKERTGSNAIVIDSIGIGAGIADIIAGMGHRVIRINSAEKSANAGMYLNLRAEMWRLAADKLAEGRIRMMQDNLLREELLETKYEIIRSGYNFQIKIEDKAKIKNRLGRSPDRADAFVMGAYYLDKAEPIIPKGPTTIRNWGYRADKQLAGSSMSA
ncbi:MAG: phage terminase large subunit [Planctomycetota bacterium]|nr:phage terminase large subunit [Planctomycetota bacterium]